jgi:hypothetical protein
MSSYSNYLRNKNTCCLEGPPGQRGERGPTGINGPTGPTGVVPALGYNGSFYDTTTQGPYTQNVAYSILIDSTDVSATNGVYIGIPTSRIYNTYYGIYNIQFSAQLTTISTGNDVDLINIWIKKNGTNVPETDGQVSIPTKSGGNIVSWNYLLELNALDYIEFYLKPVTSSNVSLSALIGSGSPPNNNPASPSIIVTYTQVASIGPTGPAGAKTFVIDHPKDNNRYLVHACLEGPEVGVYYRGTGEIINNQSIIIILPSYVPGWAKDFVVLVTAIYDGKVKTFAATEVDKNGQFIVYGENGKFNWIAVGKRDSINVEPLKSELNVNGFGPYKWIE